MVGRLSFHMAPGPRAGFQQFNLAGLVLHLLGLGSTGVWLVRQVEDGVAQATAASAVLAVDSLLASSVAKPASQDALSPARVSRLDHQLAASQLGQHLESVLRIEISDDGRVSTQPKRASSRATLSFKRCGIVRKAWAARCGSRQHRNTTPASSLPCRSLHPDAPSRTCDPLAIAWTMAKWHALCAREPEKGRNTP